MRLTTGERLEIRRRVGRVQSTLRPYSALERLDAHTEVPTRHARREARMRMLQPARQMQRRRPLPRVIAASTLVALAWSLILAASLHAQCRSVTPIQCTECFAVVVIPDTQSYSVLSRQPQGAAHLDLITRYVCENATSFQEPSTGKVMPILIALQLGDLVQSGDLREAVAGPLAEWVRVEAAFDNLDACDPVVPYLVTIGNHDYSNHNYEGSTLGYETYFGVDRWVGAGYGCKDPMDCSGAPGDWFIGGGDRVLANSRNRVGADGSPGPPTDQAGRHRAGVVRAPNGQRFLFMGLELAFDFPPPAPGREATEGDDAAWVKAVLGHYPDVPTIVFQHSTFLQNPDFVFGPEIWHSDSLTEGPPFDTGLGMEAIWNEVVVPYDQIFMAFSGHVVSPDGQDDFTLARPGGPNIAGFLRNYQGVSLAGVSDSNYGVGWTVIAVFDPEANEVRVRSYRIDDTDAYANPPIDYDHTGSPAPTECLDMDYAGVSERTVPFAFAPTAVAANDGRLWGRAALIGAFVIAGAAHFVLLRRRRV